MQPYHLHIVQCTFTRSNSCLEELKQVYQANDVIILMEESVLAIYTTHVSEFTAIHLLETDHHLLLPNTEYCTDIKCINYNDMADLISQATKVFNWR